MLKDYQGIRISKEFCENRCLAKSIIDQLPDVDMSSKIQPGKNPTSTYCQQINGRPEIYVQPDQAEVSVCIFSDKSFFVLWDLLREKK